MARTYRFFTRHLLSASLEQKPGMPLHLTEKLEPGIFYQLSKVLRAGPGDSVVLIPAGQPPPYFEYDYSVESAQKKEIVLRFTGSRKNENELDFLLKLVLCLPNKPDKLELILQKAVELGVSGVALVEGDFSRMKHNLRPERLEKIMVEAAEQSERAMVPLLETGGKLRKYLEGLSDWERERIFVAMERREGGESGEGEPGRKENGGRRHKVGAQKLQEILAGRAAKEGITILVGPEGGFSQEEKAFIERSGLKCFSLGQRILRMETAAILSLGIAALK